MLSADELIAFEESVAAEFNAGRIPHPVHLESGNEDALIEIFRAIEPRDWIFGSWRMHLKALLKGVPAETLLNAIRRGESMALSFPEQQVYGSAIAGGTLPIALGAALAIKRAGGSERVWCWVGDMMAESGIAHECMQYARRFALPVAWVIEDNGVSVCTPTADAWGGLTEWPQPGTLYYRYKSKWPHAGAGVRVQF